MKRLKFNYVDDSEEIVLINYVKDYGHSLLLDIRRVT